MKRIFPADSRGDTNRMANQFESGASLSCSNYVLCEDVAPTYLNIHVEFETDKGGEKIFEPFVFPSSRVSCLVFPWPREGAGTSLH